MLNGRRVDVFFTFHPHANKLFHPPTFLHSLTLHPNHSKFPSLPVLHAISAIGSLYTAAVTSPPTPNWNEVSPGIWITKALHVDLFFFFQTKYSWSDIAWKNRGWIRLLKHKPSLPSRQRKDLIPLEKISSKFCKVCVPRKFGCAINSLFSIANIILTWFYWSHGRFVWSSVLYIRVNLSFQMGRCEIVRISF